MRRNSVSAAGGVTALALVAAFAGCGGKPGGGKAEPVAAGLAPLEINLPKPAFIGTPKNIPPGTTVQKGTGKPRPPFMAPAGVKNVAFEKPVSASDEEPIIGEIELATDGDKEARDGSYVELGPGVQWVQVDLEEVSEVFAVLFWYYHGDPRVYHDIVVQVADDPDFITGVKTIFNNDHDNSAGLGIGKGYEYFETYEGRLVPVVGLGEGANGAGGLRTRYVRIYSNGSTADDMNRFTEVEVYGRPAAPAR